MKKRILIFSVAYHPFIGGAEIAVKELTDRLGEGFSFEMITLNLDGQQKSEEQIGNVLIHRVGGKGRIHKLFFPFVAWRKAVALHKQKPFDAIWSIMASFSGFAAVFFNYSYSNVPFILTLQEGDPIDYIKRQVRFVYPLFKRIFKRATRIQTISMYLKHFALDMGSTAPIAVIPNGVDLSLFTRAISEERKKNIRDELHITPEQKIVITTSRLVIKNGIEDIIDALTRLPRTIRLLILGTGPLEMKLKEKVKAGKLDDRVSFLGLVSNDQLPEYLSISDVFVRPSLSEGQGISFIEAMAAGVPVIATHVGGIPDFLFDRKTGLFCKVHNSESVAEKINEVVNNSDLKNSLISQAKNLVLEKYDWSLQAERMQKEIFDFI